MLTNSVDMQPVPDISLDNETDHIKYETTADQVNKHHMYCTPTVSSKLYILH